MTDTALSAAYDAIRLRLVNASSLWEMRVHPDLAPAGTPRPYVVFWHLAGGEINARRVEDASLVIGVKCVANSLAEAFAGAARLAELLNDADFPGDPLSAGDEWVIQNVQQEQALHLTETVQGGQIYHAGARFRMRLERI